METAQKMRILQFLLALPTCCLVLDNDKWFSFSGGFFHGGGVL
jgi:hypothetical protein